jgi:hypothetical protein
MKLARMDQYHALTIACVRRSFFVSLSLSLVGLGIVAAGLFIAVAMGSRGELAQFGTAGFAAAIAGYLGKTSIDVYKQALGQQDKYLLNSMSYIEKAQEMVQSAGVGMDDVKYQAQLSELILDATLKCATRRTDSYAGSARAGAKVSVPTPRRSNGRSLGASPLDRLGN